MSDPNNPNTPNPGSLPSPITYPDWTVDYQGYSANNIILAGKNNVIHNSRRCSIIQGCGSAIEDSYNTHIIGDFVSGNLSSNTFYVGCINGIHSYGDVIAYAASDTNLKDNQVKISGCLDKVQSLDAIEFDWNENQETYSGHDIGLIAQQVSGIAPEIVTERQNGYLAMKYEKMVPILVGAIQEQQIIINKMQEQINKLLDEPNC